MVLQDFGRVDSSLGDHSACRVDQLAAIQCQPFTLVNPGKDVVAHIVDERDPGLHQDPRPEIGIAARDRGHRIHHCRDIGLDQSFGTDAIKVAVVDDRDLARVQPFGEVLGAPIQPGNTAGLGRCSAFA
jgi:hypothetical protein